MSAGFDAVIFDMDGVLVDSERIIRDGFTAATQALGYAMPDGLFERLVGSTSSASARTIKGALGEDFPLEQMYELARERIDALTVDGWPRRPGALELVEALAGHGVPMAVASSTRRAGVEARLQSTSLRRFVGAICAGDEVREGKPHPEIYQQAAARLQIDPLRCIAVEDSLHGVRAAHAAGLRTVLVPDLVPAPSPLPDVVHHHFESLAALHPTLLAWLGRARAPDVER